MKRKNFIRKTAIAITEMKIRNVIVFDMVMWLAISFSSILMAFDTPLADSESTMSITLYWLDLSMTLLFTFEMFVKVIAFGVAFNGKQSYLRSG